MMYRSLAEEEHFAAVCDDGILCNEKYCPFVEGVSGRIGSCDGDFCDMTWDNYCDIHDIEWER